MSDAWVTELLLFPNGTAAHDDQVDATAYAVNAIYNRRRRGMGMFVGGFILGVFAVLLFGLFVLALS